MVQWDLHLWPLKNEWTCSFLIIHLRIILQIKTLQWREENLVEKIPLNCCFIKCCTAFPCHVFVWEMLDISWERKHLLVIALFVHYSLETIWDVLLQYNYRHHRYMQKKTDKAIVFAELDHARKRIGLTQKCVTSFEKLILFSGYLVFPCTSYLWGDHGKTFSFENF